MPDIQKVSIALTGEQLAALKEAVETGEYATTSEAVREALREWQWKRELREMVNKKEIERLKKAWDEGVASGRAEPMDFDEVLKEARRRLKKATSVAVLIVLASAHFARAQDQPAQNLKPFPPAVAVISDEKKFNAVQFGPNNTVSIMQSPTDFQLEDIGLSSNGELLAIAWASGRIEIRRVSDGKKLKEFNAGTWGLTFAEGDSLLVSYKSGGEVVVSDWKTGKTVRKLQAVLGPRKYDVRKVLYRPANDWWAYVDGEEGRAVKLSDGKAELATFGNATDMALSPDGRSIWTVGRDAVRVYSVGTWKLEKDWPLRSATLATQEPEFSMGKTVGGLDFVAVPSVDGLMLYPEEAQTSIVARGYAFIDSEDALMMVEGQTMRLLGLDGSSHCEWKQYPYHRRTASEDGRWFAIADSQEVHVWKMTALAAECK